MSYEKVMKASKLSVGTKEAARTIEAGLACEVFVAKDADPRITGKLVSLCKRMSVPVTYVDSMRQLGKACGIDVGASVVAAVSE